MGRTVAISRQLSNSFLAKVVASSSAVETELTELTKCPAENFDNSVNSVKIWRRPDKTRHFFGEVSARSF
jgi:hypothetical protein